MNSRYLLALALTPAIATVAFAQGPLAPPPPPVPPDAPPAAVAPAPAPVPSPSPPPPAPVMEPVGPAPEVPSAPPGSSGNDVLVPDLSGPPPAATLTEGPEAVNGVLPPVPGSDAVLSVDGPVGLLRVSAAEVGAPMQLRMGLSGRLFSSDDFLVETDQNLRLQGALSVGFTPIRYLEVFGSLSGSANRNRRLCTAPTPGGEVVCQSEAGRNDPEVIKSYGDLAVGTKFAYPLSGGVSAGGELGLRFLSSVTGISFNPSATSVWLTGLTSWDLRSNVALPLRLHFNLGLYFDNSDAVQNYRGISLPSKAVSQFAYGIAKNRVRGALGVEGIIDRIGPIVTLHPFAEYHLEVVTSEADPAFAKYAPPLCKPGATSSSGSSPCRDNRDQQWLTLGLRTQIKGTFAITAAVDIGVHSAGFPYGPPLPPYEVALGLSYPFDLGAPRVVTKTVVVERRIPAEKPQEGVAVGKVLAAPANTPVEGAIIAVTGRPRTRVATDPDGSFKTTALPVGLVDLEVSAPGFQSASVRTSIAAGQEAPVAVTLTPRVKNGKVSGKISDSAGKAVAATVHFVGPQTLDVKTDEAGAFAATLPGGSYAVRVEADRFGAKEWKVDVVDGQELDASTTVRPRATATHVTFKDGRLSVRHAFSFKGSGLAVDVSPASAAILDELADVLGSHPEIRRVRIETHWDTSVPADKAQELTDQQGKAVAAYLIRQGVAADRIQVSGQGASKPIVPNIGMAKLRNRRVEFRVVN